VTDRPRLQAHAEVFVKGYIGAERELEPNVGFGAFVRDNDVAEDGSAEDVKSDLTVVLLTIAGIRRNPIVTS
jgi:hypothetical protein